MLFEHERISLRQLEEPSAFAAIPLAHSSSVPCSAVTFSRMTATSCSTVSPSCMSIAMRSSPPVSSPVARAAAASDLFTSSLSVFCTLASLPSMRRDAVSNASNRSINDFNPSPSISAVPASPCNLSFAFPASPLPATPLPSSTGSTKRSRPLTYSTASIREFSIRRVPLSPKSLPARATAYAAAGVPRDVATL